MLPYFGGMIKFVKEIEPMIEKGQTQYIQVNESKFFLVFILPGGFIILLIFTFIGLLKGAKTRPRKLCWFCYHQNNLPVLCFFK